MSRLLGKRTAEPSPTVHMNAQSNALSTNQVNKADVVACTVYPKEAADFAKTYSPLLSGSSKPADQPTPPQQFYRAPVISHDPLVVPSQLRQMVSKTNQDKEETDRPAITVVNETPTSKVSPPLPTRQTPADVPRKPVFFGELKVQARQAEKARLNDYNDEAMNDASDDYEDEDFDDVDSVDESCDRQEQQPHPYPIRYEISHDQQSVEVESIKPTVTVNKRSVKSNNKRQTNDVIHRRNGRSLPRTRRNKSFSRCESPKRRGKNQPRKNIKKGLSLAIAPSRRHGEGPVDVIVIKKSPEAKSSKEMKDGKSHSSKANATRTSQSKVSSQPSSSRGSSNVGRSTKSPSSRKKKKSKETMARKKLQYSQTLF